MAAWHFYSTRFDVGRDIKIQRPHQYGYCVDYKEHGLKNKQSI